jgi:hypothetical protein
MSFAKFSHVGNAALFQTLRQAYIAMGVLPGPSSSAKKPPTLNEAPAFSATSFLASVKSSRDYLRSAKLLDFENMEPEFREKIREEVSAMIGIREELNQKLSSPMKPSNVSEIQPGAVRTGKKRRVP